MKYSSAICLVSLLFLGAFPESSVLACLCFPSSTKKQTNPIVPMIVQLIMDENWEVTENNFHSTPFIARPCFEYHLAFLAVTFHTCFDVI